MVKIVNKEPPVEEVISLRNQGRDNDDIVSELSQKGFSNQQISEAISQADIKGGVEGTIPPPIDFPPEEESPVPEGMKPSVLTPGSEIPIPVPSPEEKPPAQAFPTLEVKGPSTQVFAPGAAPSVDIESIQEIAESIIDERWQEVVASVGDITLWRSKVEDDIASIKQEILRIEDRFTKLQASIIGKVDEYQKGITQVSSEMAALEKVFGKIMEPLTSNIKELQRLTQSMKKR